jgi:D-amino-acid dehydrogenase
MHALIIGGGIIGLSSAWYLAESGWRVTVLEKGDLTDNCSFGNMGYLSPSHFVPLAAPGIVEQGILWMFDQKSPFYVRPSVNPDLIRWGLRFLRASTQAHVDRSARPLADLLLLNKTLMQEWAKKFAFGLEEKGCLMYYQTGHKEKEELENARMARELGLEIAVLSREEVQALEPDLRPDVRGAVWFKDDAHVDPNALMTRLPQELAKLGVQIERNCAVERIERNQGSITAVYAGGRRFEADVFVLAAGSWSPQIARLAGERLDLMPGKGYSMTIDTPHPRLRHPGILLEAKVALTPWPGRLRIGSTMEIGPINDRILFPRVQGILEAVPRFLPGFLDDPAFRQLADLEQLKKSVREKVWFGFRPVSHDGMPYIGHATNHKNLIMATGHAMLGVSLGAATGKVVSELAQGKPTSVGVAAFDPRRK